MWKPWKSNFNYEVPQKPKDPNEQISMVWDYIYNHLPHILHEQDNKINWEDIKLNFVLVLLAIVLGCWAHSLFV